MSRKNGLLTVPQDGELLRIPGFYPGEIPAGEEKTRVVRTLLHEWPLSRVELAELPDLPGAPRRIVKTQLSAASAEGDFYRYAGPRFRESGVGLRMPELLGRAAFGDCECLILSREAGEPEDWSGLTSDGIRERVRRIGAILQLPDSDHAPVFTDWSAPERFAADLEEDVPALLSGGVSDPERIPEWAERGGAACWEAPVGLLHGDLKADNLLTAGDEPVLLDWQRPARGPLPLEEELSVLLERGLPGEGETGGERPPARNGRFVPLTCFYLAHWYAWAWRNCLPWPFVLSLAAKYAEAGLTLMQ